MGKTHFCASPWRTIYVRVYNIYIMNLLFIFIRHILCKYLIVWMLREMERFQPSGKICLSYFDINISCNVAMLLLFLLLRSTEGISKWKSTTCEHWQLHTHTLTNVHYTTMYVLWDSHKKGFHVKKRKERERDKCNHIVNVSIYKFSFFSHCPKVERGKKLTTFFLPGIGWVKWGRVRERDVNEEGDGVECDNRSAIKFVYFHPFTHSPVRPSLYNVIVLQLLLVVFMLLPLSQMSEWVYVWGTLRQ
jgi:hypothetical protein